MNFYSALHINNLTTAIYSKTGEILYLIEGTEKAILVDTCLGVGHLKDFVGTLTNKPLTVLLTHGHVDHALGAPEFETVYMSPADKELYRRHCSPEVRERYLRDKLGAVASQITEEEFTPLCPDYHFQELVDGMVFDLGGAHVEAHCLPGHTVGSFTFLVREHNTLILGDACNNGTFLFGEYALSVEEYQDNLKAFQSKLAGRYHRVFLSYQMMDGNADLIDDAIKLCEDIKNGNTDDVPFEFMGNKAYIAKKVNDHFERVDGKFVNIIYNKNKIFRP